MRIFILCLAFTDCAAATLCAQGPGRPPLEFGVGLTAAGINDVDFIDLRLAGPALDLRVTLPLTPRFAFEATATVAGDTTASVRQTAGLYTLQIRQRIARASTGRSQVFVTYGGTGNYSRVSGPHYAYNATDPPVFTTAGVSFQQTLGRHVAVRFDAQAITLLYLPLAARVSAGLSIPLRR
jgi:hypothetical protein